MMTRKTGAVLCPCARNWGGTGLLMILVAAPCSAAPATGPHGSVDLIAESTAIQPARPFWVGLHFQLEQGWHIYWANPGDSGEPPRVKWSLPGGFEAGELKWPLPQRIDDHSLVDYGYLGAVLLPAQVTASASLTVGQKVTLNAAVSWLVCREICVPVHSTLTLDLPVAMAAAPAATARGLFATARAAMPQPLPKAWKASATLTAHQFILDLDTGQRENEATFFPLEATQIDNAAPQKATPMARGIRLELARSDQLLKAPSQLVGVLKLGTLGYVISAPVATSK